MSRRIRSGVTMIEVLVVLAVLAFLAALLVPAVQQVRGAAARTQSMNNMKQICLGLHAHHDAFRKLPPAFDKRGKSKTAASIHVYLLPFIEQEPVYKLYMQNDGGEEASNYSIPVFISPQDPTVKADSKAIQNYAANLRVFSNKGRKTAYDADMPKLDEIEGGIVTLASGFPDGTANTIVYSTKHGVCGEGGSKYASAPNSKTAAFFGQNAATEKAGPTAAKATFQLMPGPKECLCSPLMAQSFVKAHILVGMADASARHVAAGISPQTWNAALCPNDGQALGDDW